MTKPENRQALRTESTRARLLEVARGLFAERGFAGVPAEELVARAGLTRGALYHHFGGKEGLFAALYEQMQQELTEQINARAEGALDPWSALKLGCQAFLEACTDRAVQQIVLLDAPAVLSWERWREVDSQYGLGSLKDGLQAAMQAGFLKPQPLDALAHLLEGAMNEAAMWIARSPDPKTALQQAHKALDGLLEGLRH
ncbi:MAG: TetR family transcriptional regulator [Meiothermus sp.]